MGHAKKRIDAGDRAAFNRFYGDLLYTEGRYEEALEAYLKADRGDDTDARARHGVYEECLERLGGAWKSAKGSESDAARRLIRRSENGRLTLGAPYAERLQTQIPATKSWSDANVSSS